VNDEVPRLNFVVEGQTEETFVRDLLAEHLAIHGVYAAARCVETSRTRLKIFKGGMSTYARAKGDIERWLKEDRTAYLTTMFDLYGLPDDFPNMAKKTFDPHKKAELIESGIAADIDDPRFIPYIQVHEFEALLFCAPPITDAALGSPPAVSKLRELHDIRRAFPSPEHINDGVDTAPSKRIVQLYTGYRKQVFGPLITKRVGLTVLRGECPHFHDWISQLETLPR
jgi:Domain of unknown function (DUF4276)